MAAGFAAIVVRWPEPARRAEDSGVRSQSTASAALPPAKLRWIAAAGGGTPEFNQVSIEQDLGLAREVLGSGGRILFAAGPGAAVVQVSASGSSPDTLRTKLADLFAPRGGRSARYREPEIQVSGPATAATVRTLLTEATARRGDPLLVYLAGHGHIGESARDNSVEFWEQSRLSVTELAQILDDGQRSVQLVMTTCYSGGFADIVFKAGDVAQGPSKTVRCGLFATPWDLEAAGCDPNPDRRQQEGYGLHFLNALRGKDRDGNDLSPAILDVDGDGAVSPLEAHTRVRIASEAGDVPTTTSERWLREVVKDAAGPAQPVELAEEDAVVESLAPKLRLSPDLDVVRTQLETLEKEIESSLDAVATEEREEAKTYRAAAAELLARWPVLDDPWHPDFAAVFARDREAIDEALAGSNSYRAYLAARSAVDEAANRVAELRKRAAPYERLVRALENRVLAQRLKAHGGAEWKRYEDLLRCERARVPGPQAAK